MSEHWIALHSKTSQMRNLSQLEHLCTLAQLVVSYLKALQCLKAHHVSDTGDAVVGEVELHHSPHFRPALFWVENTNAPSK